MTLVYWDRTQTRVVPRTHSTQVSDGVAHLPEVEGNPNHGLIHRTKTNEHPKPRPDLAHVAGPLPIPETSALTVSQNVFLVVNLVISVERAAVARPSDAGVVFPEATVEIDLTPVFRQIALFGEVLKSDSAWILSFSPPFSSDLNARLNVWTILSASPFD